MPARRRKKGDKSDLPIRMLINGGSPQPRKTADVSRSLMKPASLNIILI